MKTLIVYYSSHHGNTKKLVDAIVAQGNVTAVDASAITVTDCSDYDLIGFASGIYYQKFHESILKWAKSNLPTNKNVFFLYTCGVKRGSYTDAIKQIAETKNSKIQGCYGCLGFDTFGPFKLVGGIAKGHPNDEDISAAVHFFCEIRNKA